MENNTTVDLKRKREDEEEEEEEEEVDLKRKREDDEEDEDEDEDEEEEEDDDEEANNSFSTQDHAICCDEIINGTRRPHLLKNHLNFIQNGPPHRVLVYEDDDWIDFLLENDIGLVEKLFTETKQVLFHVQFRGNPHVADFLHMILIDIKTASQKPIGWMNKAGKCFFPTNFTVHDCYRRSDEEVRLLMEAEDKKAKEILRATVAKNQVAGKNKGIRSLPKERIHTICQILTREEKQHFYLNKDYIVGMRGLTDDRAEARSKLFEKEVEIIEKSRGDANVRYAWLATSKEAVSRILRDGIVLDDLPKANPTYGIGVLLATASCPHISASYCDIDEDGLQYMVLCRVILGNVELVHPGSKQCSPSSKNLDSGVDDLLNPKQYIIWNKNMKTHIYPEYVVSIKSSPIAEGHPSDSGSKDAASLVNNCTACHVNLRGNCRQTPIPAGISQQSKTTRFAGNPSIFFMLLKEMEAKIPYKVMKIVYQLYEHHKKKKMSRDQLFHMMRLIVGDNLLRDSLISLGPKLG